MQDNAWSKDLTVDVGGHGPSAADQTAGSDPSEAEVRAEVREPSSLRRVMTADKVAAVVAFLASSARSP